MRRFDEAPWCPFQFTICLYVAQIPPLWFWAMNDRAKAVNNFTKGIKTEKVSFNNMQSLTSKDKTVLRVGYAYFTAITLFFGYLALFSDATCVLKIK